MRRKALNFETRTDSASDSNMEQENHNSLSGIAAETLEK